MDTPDFTNLRKQYKDSVETWISAIRAEERLATADHRMIAMERWDQAINTVEQMEGNVKKTRCDYQDALRQANYGF